MVDLSTSFLGIKSPNPFWLASAPPTDRKTNVERAFRAGWGGVVWKTLGEAGPPVVNVSGAALRRDPRPRPAADGVQQHRADHRPRSRDQPARDQGGQARLARPRAGGLADGAVRRRRRGSAILARVEETECRRHRAEFRLPARHVRARHGLGGRPGARVHRDGRALVQGAHAHARHRQADAQHRRHPASRARRQEGRRRRGVADQHHQLDHGRRSRRDGADARDRRQGHPRRHVRPCGQADRAVDGVGDRPRSGNRRYADLGDRRRRRRGATPPSSSRSARATCRCAPR